MRVTWTCDGCELRLETANLLPPLGWVQPGGAHQADGPHLCNQRWADERIPILLDTPAAVRFISAEPLLGELTLYPWLFETPGIGIDWLIIGGESGSRHRPFNADWARDLLHQCADTACHPFVKQLGGARPGNALEDLPLDLQVREYPDTLAESRPED